MQLGLQNIILPLLPTRLNRWIVHRVYSKISLTFTNVPGPQEMVSIADQPVDSVMFQASASHSVLGILSYRGQVYITFNFRKGAIDNSHLLPKCFMKALATLGNEFKIDVPHAIQT